jgi:uncharacterized protein YbaP (TraB family)
MFAGRLMVSALLWWSLSLATDAGESLHTFWSVKGRHNTVYLLGSVHMLKPADSALPAEALHAYADSKLLVMELDLNDISADQLLVASQQRATLPPGQTLAGVLGPQLYSRFASQMQGDGVQPELLDHSQPWFAALMLEQMELAKSGFEPAAGIDEQFAQLAHADHKPVIGLETIDEQLAIFANLPLDQQRQYLSSTLDDSGTDASDTQAIVLAWQHGDLARLEQLLREGSSDSPELYRMLTTERNRKWLPKIIGLLNDDDNCLVIVGAMHLIGHDGVVELLQRQGYLAVQH